MPNSADDDRIAERTVVIRRMTCAVRCRGDATAAGSMTSIEPESCVDDPVAAIGF
jgi:hypothetical protein